MSAPPMVRPMHHQIEMSSQPPTNRTTPDSGLGPDDRQERRHAPPGFQNHPGRPMMDNRQAIHRPNMGNPPYGGGPLGPNPNVGGNFDFRKNQQGDAIPGGRPQGGFQPQYGGGPGPGSHGYGPGPQQFHGHPGPPGGYYGKSQGSNVSSASQSLVGTAEGTTYADDSHPHMQQPQFGARPAPPMGQHLGNPLLVQQRGPANGMYGGPNQHQIPPPPHMASQQMHPPGGQQQPQPMQFHPQHQPNQMDVNRASMTSSSATNVVSSGYESIEQPGDTSHTMTAPGENGGPGGSQSAPPPHMFIQHPHHHQQQFYPAQPQISGATAVPHHAQVSHPNQPPGPHQPPAGMVMMAPQQHQQAMYMATPNPQQQQHVSVQPGMNQPQYMQVMNGNEQPIMVPNQVQYAARPPSMVYRPEGVYFAPQPPSNPQQFVVVSQQHTLPQMHDGMKADSVTSKDTAGPNHSAMPGIQPVYQVPMVQGAGGQMIVSADGVRPAQMMPPNMFAVSNGQRFLVTHPGWQQAPCMTQMPPGAYPQQFASPRGGGGSRTPRHGGSFRGNRSNQSFSRQSSMSVTEDHSRNDLTQVANKLQELNVECEKRDRPKQILKLAEQKSESETPPSEPEPSPTDRNNAVPAPPTSAACQDHDADDETPAEPQHAVASAVSTPPDVPFTQPQVYVNSAYATTVKTSKECYYCKTNGQPKEVYLTHSIYTEDKTTVECPVMIRELKCEECGNVGGIHAHSTKFCPQKKRKDLGVTITPDPVREREGGHQGGHQRPYHHQQQHQRQNQYQQQPRSNRPQGVYRPGPPNVKEQLARRN